MFDDIGRTRDADARRREATSVGLTALLVAGVVGFQMGLAAFYVTGLVGEDPVDAELVMLVEPEAPGTPDAAPAPPPPPRGSAEPTTRPEPTTEPSEPVTAHDPEPANTVRDAADAPGTAGGDPNGEIGGQPGGIPGGQVGATGAGSGTGDGDGSGTVAFHASELRRIRKIDPEYPRAAKGQGFGEVSCRVQVVIDERGAPIEVQVLDCPVPFHAETRDAMMRSRWAPAKVDGQIVRASTQLRIRYVER